VSATARSVARARQILEREYAGDVTIIEVARRVSLSVFQLSRAFRRQYGTTPGAFLRDVRIAHAKALLAKTSLPVGEIGRSCGYRSHASFTGRFRAITGVSPSEYRDHGEAHAKL
jgi:transcriptional regulator GlxA family with amidase domain